MKNNGGTNAWYPTFAYYENTSLILHVSLGKVSGMKHSDSKHFTRQQIHWKCGEQYEQYEKGIG